MNGPFQTTEEIIDVNGIGQGIFNRIADLITVDDNSSLRTFTGSFVVTLTTDGVNETHVDSNMENPNSLVETWAFTMTASPSGEVISGAWDDNTKHPDFAWAPYLNTVRSGRSENNFLYWPHLRDYIPGHNRQ